MNKLLALGLLLALPALAAAVLPSLYAWDDA